MMRPLRRDYSQYPPPMYGGGAGGNAYPLGGGGMQNGGMGGGQQQQPVQQQQQQQQQMHPQGMQQQQQQGAPPGAQTASDGQSNPGGAAPEMNLANVLHYLQSEWRRWERDRNEWEIERAEMRARIALLEGQRRSAENLKVDLLRRVKMLEFALRQERTKAGRPTSSSLAPSRLTALQDEDRKGGDTDKEGSGSSEGGDDLADRQLKVNGVHAVGVAKAASAANRPVPDSSSWKNLSGPPRDPKARARSREYLKQCLQEITYLTSPGALNPIPPRAPVSVDEAASPTGEGSSERPRKSLPEQPIVSPYAQPEAAKEEATAAGPSTSNAPNGPNTTEEANAQAQTSEAGSSSFATAAPADAPPSSPAPRTVDLPEGETEASGEPRQVLTAIYRPESKAAWREELRAANEAASKVPWPPRRQSDEQQLAELTLVDEDIKEETDAGSDRVWTTRRALKSHLDVVRGVAIARGPDLVLATGGDDCTVKVWVLDTPSVMSSSMRPLAATETEPVATYRGHTQPVTAVTISSSLNIVFSASMDSTIRLWHRPARDHDPYAPYDPSTAIQTLEGHTDVVWDLCLLPPRPERNGAASTNPNGKRQPVESQLVSVSADGTAKLWEDHDGRWALQASFGNYGDGVVPTCLSVDNHDFSRVLVGLSNGLVKLYNVEDAREIQTFGEAGPQVNAILSHPTLPLLVTGHEDGHLRFYETTSGNAQSLPLLAHPAPITSLALSPLSPTCILTASVDCSVRLWDLHRKTSLQDLSGHRQRSDEGVTHVASHPELPIIASAGADGVVRLWGAG